MKTIADFKRKLIVGAKVHCTLHRQVFVDPETKEVITKDEDKGIRPVSVVQSNSFAFQTTKFDGSVVDSWCDYPTKDFIKFYPEDQNKVTILRKDNKLPALTYTFV